MWNSIPWGQNWGVTFPSAFNSTVLSALQKFNNCYSSTALSDLQNWTKNGCASRMVSFISHVASSRPQCFLCTFICPMAWYGTLPSPFLHHQHTPHDLFLVLENPSPQLGTFPMSLETSNTYAQAPSNESISMSVLIKFSKIIDESHAHVYWHKIN